MNSTAGLDPMFPWKPAAEEAGSGFDNDCIAHGKPIRGIGLLSYTA